MPLKKSVLLGDLTETTEGVSSGSPMCRLLGDVTETMQAVGTQNRKSLRDLNFSRLLRFFKQTMELARKEPEMLDCLKQLNLDSKYSFFPIDKHAHSFR